jgi:exosortase A
MIRSSFSEFFDSKFWLNKWQLLTVFILQFVVFLPAWKSFYRTWSTQDFSYGWLILPTSLWLIWRMRSRLNEQSMKPTFWGCLAALLGAMIWSIGYYTATASVMQLGVVVVIVSCVVGLVGLAISRIIWFPLLFAFMMVPMLGWMTPRLTDWTADAVHFGLQILEIPVYREGGDFVLPTGRWSVIDACSGLRYVLSAMVLSVLFAHLNFRKFGHGALFVFTALIASVLANWVRATITVLLGHMTNMQFGPGEEHVWLGWIVFGVVMLFLFKIAGRWADVETPIDCRLSEEKSTNTVGLDQLTTRYSTKRRTTVFCTLVVVLCGVGIGAQHVSISTPQGQAASFLTTALLGSDLSRLAYEPKFEGARTVVRKKLSQDGLTGLIAYYADQPVSGSMISLINDVVPNDEDATSKLRRLSVKTHMTGADSSVTFRQLDIQRKGQQLRVLYWYTVNGVHTISPVHAKLLTLKGLVSGLGDHSTLNMLVFELNSFESELLESDYKFIGALSAISRQLTYMRNLRLPN